MFVKTTAPWRAGIYEDCVLSIVGRRGLPGGSSGQVTSYLLVAAEGAIAQQKQNHSELVSLICNVHQEEERRKQEELEALRRREDEKRAEEEAAAAAVAAALAQQQQEEQKRRDQEAQRQQELQRQRQQQQEALRRLQQQQQQQQLAQMKVRRRTIVAIRIHDNNFITIHRKCISQQISTIYLYI